MVPKPTGLMLSLPNVPTPIGSFPLLSYTNGNPLVIWWSFKKDKVSFTLSIPPDSEVNLPSNNISLFLFVIIGLNIAPEPLPPSMDTDNTFWMSKSCGSICISTTYPLTTGWTKAVVFPVPGDEISNVGGFKTS